MTAPITMHEVEQEIVRLSNLLDHATTEIAKRARDAAGKRARAKVDLAKAFLEARGTVTTNGRPISADACEAHARAACEQQVIDDEMAQAVLLAAQEAARNTRAQLDALRSVMANVRHQVT